jgi:GAF domain-containing protein
MGKNEMGYFRLFRDVCKVMNASLDVKEVLKLITGNVVTVLEAKASTIFLLDKKKKRLEIGASFGVSKGYLNKGPLDSEISILESLEGTPVMVYDATNDSRIQYPEEAKKEGIASILSVPIPVKGNVIGVLRIYTSQPREFTDDEIELVRSLAEMGGIAIENARMYHHVKTDYEIMFNDVHQWFEFGGPG